MEEVMVPEDIVTISCARLTAQYGGAQGRLGP